MGYLVDAKRREIAGVKSQIENVRQKISDKTDEHDDLVTFKGKVGETRGSITGQVNAAKHALEPLYKYRKKNKSVEGYITGMSDSLTGIGVGLVCLALDVLSGLCWKEKLDIYAEIGLLETELGFLKGRLATLQGELKLLELADEVI